mmetsp:Transcript_67134/g.162199  ORF Transcript_67134/g.162199 Transcript_67134/m.162199 type:complete len:279 (+) Transcript_67134:398-1234(+)
MLVLPLGQLVPHFVLHPPEEPHHRLAPAAQGVEEKHQHVRVRARQRVFVVRLLVRDIAGAGAGQEVAAAPGGNGALDAALHKAEDVRLGAGLGVAEADESAAPLDVLHVGREGVLELDVADEPRARLTESPTSDVGPVVVRVAEVVLRLHLDQRAPHTPCMMSTSCRSTVWWRWLWPARPMLLAASPMGSCTRPPRAVHVGSPEARASSRGRPSRRCTMMRIAHVGTRNSRRIGTALSTSPACGWLAETKRTASRRGTPTRFSSFQNPSHAAWCTIKE